MALNNMGLGFMFTAQNLASGTINRLQGEVGALGTQTRASGGMMRAGFAVAAAGIAPLVAGIGTLATSLSLADAAANFQQGVEKVGNISGATAEELEQLRDKAVEAGLRTQFSPDESIEGLSRLAAMGFNASESMDVLDQSLNLAAGGGVEIEEASKAAASAIRVFSLNAEEQAQTADKLLKITNMTSLQAGDLSLALSRVSRGAGVANQSLDEMLVAMGLVRNTGAEASVSANAVSRALLNMGTKAAEFEEIGVKTADAEGKFRPFLDVILDTSVALEDIESETDRAAKATELFGKFGLTAFAGISNQIDQMVKKNADIETTEQAVSQLREEMGDAKGTAEEFASSLLDTFAGQKRILGGVAQTLAVVLGEPFAKVFKPIVSAISGVLSTVAGVFDKIPKGAQVAIAAFIVFTGVVFTLIGALTILSGLLVIIAPFIIAIVKVMLALSAAMLPLVAVFGLLGGAIALMVVAAKKNLGGFGDFVSGVFDDIKLAFNAVTQLFSDGGFSGAVREELNKAENQGIKDFAISVFRIGSRIKTFFEGMIEGFRQAGDILGPPFERLVDAFKDLGRQLGFVGEEGGKMVNDVPLDEFGKKGFDVAQTISRGLGVVVDVIAAVVAFTADIVEGFNDFKKALEPTFELMKKVFSKTGDALDNLFRSLSGGTAEGEDEASSMATSLGRAFTFVIQNVANMVTGIVMFVGMFADAASTVINAWRRVVDFFSVLAVSVQTTFNNVVDNIRNAIDRVISFVANIARRLPAQIRPDVLNDLIEEGGAAEERIANRRRNIGIRQRAAATTVAQIETEAAAREGRDVDQERQAEQMRTAAGADLGPLADRLEAAANRPVEVVLDGEIIARATAEGNRKAGARGFVPVPTEVE